MDIFLLVVLVWVVLALAFLAWWGLWSWHYYRRRGPDAWRDFERQDFEQEAQPWRRKTRLS